MGEPYQRSVAAKAPHVVASGGLIHDRALGRATVGQVVGQQVIDGICIATQDDPEEDIREIALGIDTPSLQVSMSVAKVGLFSAPRSWPSDRAFSAGGSSQGHSAQVGQLVEFHYRWHPFYGG